MPHRIRWQAETPAFLSVFLFCFIGYFNGCGKTTFVMAQGIAGAFLVRIPVSFFMSRLEPVSLFFVGLATPASTVIQIILCTLYMVWLARMAKRDACRLPQNAADKGAQA